MNRRELLKALPCVGLLGLPDAKAQPVKPTKFEPGQMWLRKVIDTSAYESTRLGEYDLYELCMIYILFEAGVEGKTEWPAGAFVHVLWRQDTDGCMWNYIHTKENDYRLGDYPVLGVLYVHEIKDMIYLGKITYPDLKSLAPSIKK